MRWRDRVCVTGGALALGAATVAGPIDVVGPWALPAGARADTPVMMELRNAGTAPDTLISAACAGASVTTLADGDRALAKLDLPPGAVVRFSADGVHLVAHQLDQAATVGRLLHCTATFARTGERLFEATVRQSAPVVQPD